MSPEVAPGPSAGRSRGRRVRIARLHQAIDRFLFHPVGFRGGQFLVQLIQFRSGDVLLFVNSQNLVLFLVLDQLFLRGLDLHLEVHQLFRQPVRGLHGGLEAGLEILLDIGGDERVHHVGSEVLVGAAVVDLDDPGIGHQRDAEAALESSE